MAAADRDEAEREDGGADSVRTQLNKVGRPHAESGGNTM